MRMELKVHHIEVIANADSTLIIARNVSAAGPWAHVRSVLIDRGLLSASRPAQR
jgi:hypothetical protein